MKIEEVRALSSEELRGQLQSSQRKLVELRFKAATRQLRNTNEIRFLRRDIARMKTILKERELGR